MTTRRWAMSGASASPVLWRVRTRLRGLRRRASGRADLLSDANAAIQAAVSGVWAGGGGVHVAVLLSHGDDVIEWEVWAR